MVAQQNIIDVIIIFELELWLRSVYKRMHSATAAGLCGVYMAFYT